MILAITQALMQSPEGWLLLMQAIMDWNIYLFLLWQIISVVSPEEAFRYLRQSRISRFRFIKSRNQDGK